LTLTWREVGPGNSSGDSTGRIVTKQDAIRHLKLKENESLVKRNWLPVIINGCWVLARHVKRLGPNRLRISGHSYDYEIHEGNGPLGDRIEDYNLVTTFKARLGGKVVNKTMLNGSVRMVIRFFLNHEEVLKPQFAGHKVIEGEV
jgi:hypothetical protein